MRELNFQGKIILPTVLISAVLVIILTVYSMSNFENFTDLLLSDRIMAAANSLKTHLEEAEQASITAATTSAADPDVIKAVREHDTETLLHLLTPPFESRMVNFYTVCDKDGIVIARTHEPLNWGDSVLEQQNISDALSGKEGTYYEEGTVVKVSVRTGAPIYDTDDTIIGAVSAGLRLDQNDMVDALKKHYNVDCTVFVGDTRIASTIFSDGERIVGTRLSPDIANIVIGEKREYFGNSNIQGEDYSTFYMPLFDSHHNVFAVFFAGLSREALISKTNSLVRDKILIGVMGLVVSILVMLLIGGRIIRPVNRLVNIVSEVSRGNVNIAIDRTHISRDEVGLLTYDIYSLIDVIRMILDDLSLLAYDFSVDKNIAHRIDTSKYSGSYRKMTEDINSLIDVVSEMNKTMVVMDYLENMICILDMDYNLLFVNRSLEKAFGVSREQCLQRKCYHVLHNYDEPCPNCPLPAVVLRKEPLPSMTYTNEWNNTLGTWIGGRAAFMRWVDGSLVYFHSMQDVTTRKSHEEELDSAKRAAEGASIAKSNFLANMSHEMRTPLNVIVGISDLVMERDNLPFSVKEDIRKISSAGELLLGIVNDVLDISKIEAGKLELVPVNYDMPSLLNDVITLNMNRIESKPIEFKLDLSEDLPSRLYGDDLRVKQIFNNLLSNAFKYTQQGTVTLRVFSSRGNKKDVWLFIAISDSGIGIHQEDLDKLFTDYNQVNARANRRIEGTGLGLSITRQLVELMDGEISVESQYGSGTTFHVRIRQDCLTDRKIGADVVENLSKFRYTEQKPHRAGRIERPDLSFARVLVVDDFPTNLYVAEGMLSKYKMKVDCVTCGEQAIERIQNKRVVYHAIFMDHMMPGMDGIETTHRIRSLDTEYARAIPIIALTANAIAGNAQMFIDEGFQAFIPKPLNVVKLDSVVKQWIHRKAGEPAESADAESGVPAEDLLPADHISIDIPGVDGSDVMELYDGDLEIYLPALESYTATIPGVLDKLRVVTPETLKEYAINIHGLKGSSAGIGAEEAQREAAKLESMAKAGDLSGVLAQNDAFLKYMEDLLAGMCSYLTKARI